MDYVTIEARLRRIADLCRGLDPAIEAPFERYAASPELQAATERRVHAALHSVVIIASLIVTGRDWGRPGSARDAIGTLGERLVLEEALAGRLKAAVGLRDQLLHDDLALTPARLHIQLDGLVYDLRTFQARISSWIDDQTLHEPEA